MMNLSSIRFLLAVALLGAAGCAKTVPFQQTPLAQDEVDRFLASGRDAREYGITTYQDAAGPRFESANRIHLDRSVQLDFSSPPKWPFPIVQAKTALSDAFPLLLDSSARQNWTVMQSMKAMEYRAFAPPTGEYADHVASDIPGYAGVGNKLIFKDLHVEYPIFYLPPARGGLGSLARIADLPGQDPRTAETREKFAGRMPAVMGAALMRSFSFLRFDFPGRTVLLSTSRAYRPAMLSAVAANLPMLNWRGRPAVQGTLGGQPLLLVIDTAGEFDLSLPGSALEGEAPGPLVLGNHSVEDLRLRFHGELGLPESFPARLGLGVLSRFAVTLDYKNQRVWFEGKPLPAAEESATTPEDETPAPVQYRGVPR